ncbi:MAG TPA: TetR/AcrR family transcriptional regulator [Acidimicrobiia bacterium]|nr:TetR/AcrR family transcriptional regulator [Acidimicrobiia bacterium]
MRVTVEQRETNRARLLEAAATEFARAGLDAANINEISLAAGFAKGTVYNHFPSKEALFLAVVEEACARAAGGAERPRSGAPTAERLRAILGSKVEWVREHEDFARVLVREVLTADPRFYPNILAAAAPFIESVLAILRDGVDRGEVRADLPVDQLALIFTGLGELALLQHWGSGGAWPTLEAIPDLVTGAFLEGAAPRASAPKARSRR